MAQHLIEKSKEGDICSTRNESVNGYPLSIFADVSKVRLFKCTMCHAICKDAVELVSSDNMSLYCELCAQECSNSTHQTEYQVVSFVRRSIANARVKCQSAPRCRWIGRLSDRDKHTQSECKFKCVPCHFAQMGCKYVAAMSDMCKHENSKDVIAEHLRLVVSHTNGTKKEMKEEIKKKEETIEFLKTEVQTLKQEMQAFKLEMRSEIERIKPSHQRDTINTIEEKNESEHITLTVHEHRGHYGDDDYHPSNLLQYDGCYYSKDISTFSSGEPDWITFKVEGDKVFKKITRFRIRNSGETYGVSLMRISVSRDNKKWTDMQEEIKVKKGYARQTFPINPPLQLDGFQFIKVYLLENHGKTGDNSIKFRIYKLQFFGVK